MRFVINLLLFSLTCSATVLLADTSPTDQRRTLIEQLTENPGEEGIQRKARSIAVLEARNIPYIERLPVIADTDQSLRREESAIVKRLVALAIVAVKGETGDHKLGPDLLEQFQAREFLTPLELGFMNDPTPSQHDMIQFVWRYESAWVMFWALGFRDTLGPEDQIADVPWMADLLLKEGTAGLMEKAQLRSQAEILDATDLIYRMHWAVTDARINNEIMPGGLDGSIVYERHYSLNWLIGYADLAWDDMATDT
ncbi:MAG: DUF4272 domain-containing protein [Halocynthiibacter sp.]